MPEVVELDLPRIDLSDPGLKGRRWHAQMESIIEGGDWLAEAPLATVVLDREAGEFFLRSKAAIFPGLLLAQIFGVVDGPLHEQITNNIINVNGDAHRRLRGLVNPSLTPRAANRYRPAMKEILEGLAAALDGRPEFDFVEAFARPYPSLTISRVMGAPPEDAPKLHDWSMWIQRQFDPISLADAATVEVMQSKVGEFYDWVRPLIEQRRGRPANDLISNLIASEEEGEKLSDVELENLVLNILVGGVDTTQNQLAHAIRLLADRPDQWAALRSDPEGLAPKAAQEALRFEPITPFTARQLMEPVEYRGVTFPQGTVLMICSFAGNRDAETFERPFEFDIAAERGKARMLTFGAGFHYCVGANLARAELEEGLAFLAREFETVESAGKAELQTVSGIYGIDSMPLRVT